MSLMKWIIISIADTSLIKDLSIQYANYKSK